ncbi:MAG: nickel transporter permease [Candidatus Methanospirareceae archaeon]
MKQKQKQNSELADFVSQFRENRTALVGAAVILLLVLVAIFAPQLAPHNPIKASLGDRLSAPSEKYPLGTDHLGRCVLSRLLYGARISLAVGVVVVGVAAAVGVALGIISGFYGGVLDEIIMRLVDAMLAFPSIFLALAIAGTLGPGLGNVMIAIIVVEWTRYARVMRGSILSVKENYYVEAARALGASDFYVVTRHILPNAIAPIIVVATLGMAPVILAATSLSFLGLGVQPPTPEWGMMLNDGRLFMRRAPHLTTFPGVAIMITILAFNLLGDGLRDALDPRARTEKELR